ncbi:unnamed protein product [Pocillopora meandrina]|uniref:EGF-like domain-containing protein n=1 Tax=Pocillopora meandrina TaxID=46732 RepID=A0AAU9X9L7_9CNID|nr:unnamed protein product [Pocillopora meandrina]
MITWGSSCLDYFLIFSLLLQFLDMDECKSDISDCDVNANCTNMYGSYKCKCKAGYTGDGHSCSDINECNNGSHSCDVNANCENTNGSHNCICKEGYIGDGQSCQGI